MPVPVNTELAAGLVQRPRPHGDGRARAGRRRDRRGARAPAPRRLRAEGDRRRVRLGALLPRRLAEAIGRSAKTDRILADADLAARAAYEQRAAASEPSREPEHVEDALRRRARAAPRARRLRAFSRAGRAADDAQVLRDACPTATRSERRAPSRGRCRDPRSARSAAPGRRVAASEPRSPAAERLHQPESAEVSA